MPSLRRSFSSPSVRSSPYSSAITYTARPRPTPRRSSASATAERRVLADIEWWRVYDGQCDFDLQDHAHEAVHEFDPDVPPGGTVTLSAGGDSPFAPSQTYASLDPMQHIYPNALVALPIAPHFPSGSRHGRESSVESTPELFVSPLETVQHGPASPASRPLDVLLPSLSPLTRGASRQAHPLFGIRSVSAPGLSHQETLSPDFADMGGNSFSFDQNLFQ